LIDDAIEPVLGTNVYQPKKVHGWCSAVVEGALKKLQGSNKPFKYVVTCIIMQKNGAGLHTASTCYWDTLTDGSCSVRWENATMHAIVTVFALHI
jgi:dynein light chain Tctex-type 1